MPFYNVTYRIKNGEHIPGTWLRAFIRNGGYYSVTEVKIYRDGNIDCWGLMDMEEFRRKLLVERWIVLRVPEGARVNFENGISFTVTSFYGHVSDNDFLAQVEDEIRELNDEATTLDIARQALAEYKEVQTPEALSRLRAAYEAVPTHRRMFLGSQDDKDGEFRAALGL
jgi:hypothetical protein